MRYVIADLEATCWEKGACSDRMEIIEIGAVVLPGATDPIADDFQRFVRPLHEPMLSDFCVKLTGIQQNQVDAADLFPVAFAAFLEWIGPEPFMLCSWGAYDLKQFRTDCRRHGVPCPESFDEHINLKQSFADLQGTKPCGMKAALRRLGLPLLGQHHRAFDDARNIATIGQIVLPHHENKPK